MFKHLGQGRVRAGLYDRRAGAWRGSTFAGPGSQPVEHRGVRLFLSALGGPQACRRPGQKASSRIVVIDAVVDALARHVTTRNGARTALTDQLPAQRAITEGPAACVAEHVQAAYATTAHRAQGRTVDTARVLVSPTKKSEALYVGATHGRDANHIYLTRTSTPTQTPPLGTLASASPPTRPTFWAGRYRTRGPS